MSEIRLNRLTGEWVIIAPERAKRGGNLDRISERPPVPRFLDTCPFCPGVKDGTTDERFRHLDENGGWSVRSIVNKFSVLSPTGDVLPPNKTGALEVVVNGVGLHEVLVESPRHDLGMGQMATEQVLQILKAYLDRFRAFYSDSRIRHVIVFKNHGADAGASQQHPHSQIVGTPIVPGQVVERIERARRCYADTNQCLSCSLIEQERQHATRIVAENSAFVAFIPYAALSPYHLWIFPKEHRACFANETDSTLPALAEILQSVLAKLHGLLGNPAFNLVIRSLSPSDEESPSFHWYVSVVARVNKTAGFELGTGMYVNPSLPEQSAASLREYADNATGL
jgi:UDPglucose--hexose-1-phosphate uridylyltransferase